MTTLTTTLTTTLATPLATTLATTLTSMSATTLTTLLATTPTSISKATLATTSAKTSSTIVATAGTAITTTTTTATTAVATTVETRTRCGPVAGVGFQSLGLWRLIRRCAQYTVIYSGFCCFLYLVINMPTCQKNCFHRIDTCFLFFTIKCRRYHHFWHEGRAS